MFAAAATQVKMNCCMPWFQMREAVERKLVQRPASSRRINDPECCRQLLACITSASLPAQQVKLENIECFFLGAFALHAVRTREAERVHAYVHAGLFIVPFKCCYARQHTTQLSRVAYTVEAVA